MTPITSDEKVYYLKKASNPQHELTKQDIVTDLFRIVKEYSEEYQGGYRSFELIPRGLNSVHMKKKATIDGITYEDRTTERRLRAFTESALTLEKIAKQRLAELDPKAAWCDKHGAPPLIQAPLYPGCDFQILRILDWRALNEKPYNTLHLDWAEMAAQKILSEARSQIENGSDAVEMNYNIFPNIDIETVYGKIQVRSHEDRFEKISRAVQKVAQKHFKGLPVYIKWGTTTSMVSPSEALDSSQCAFLKKSGYVKIGSKRLF